MLTAKLILKRGYQHSQSIGRMQQASNTTSLKVRKVRKTVHQSGKIIPTITSIHSVEQITCRRRYFSGQTQTTRQAKAGIFCLKTKGTFQGYNSAKR